MEELIKNLELTLEEVRAIKKQQRQIISNLK